MDMLPSSPLPADPLLEILARCDPATVIRCAATCKPWYRCITDPAFPRLLRAHTGGGRSVTCPVGGFFWCCSSGDDDRCGFTEARMSPSSWSCDDTTSPVAKTIRSFLSRNAARLRSFKPVESRGGLVLFRGGIQWGAWDWGTQQKRRLWICNPVTGWRRSIPAPDVYAQAHVLLPGEDGRSFQLVAVNLGTLRSYDYLTFQTFTSEAGDTHGATTAMVEMDGGAWGPVTEVPAEDFERVVRPTPVVLGRVAYWLFRTCGEYNVLALDADASRAACIDVPPESALDSGAIPRNEVLLSSTADGRLSLLAGEETRISVWALSTAATTTAEGWSLHATYEREWIARLVAPRRPRRKPGCPLIDLVRGGGGGGAFVGVHGFGSYVLLNTVTNEIVRTEVARSSCICPFEYEVDLALLTAPMKSF